MIISIWLMKMTYLIGMITAALCGALAYAGFHYVMEKIKIPLIGTLFMKKNRTTFLF